MGTVVAVLQKNLSRALRAGRLDDAASALELLKHEDPLSVYTRGGELELLLRLNRLDEADLLAGQLVESFPESARILYLAGRVAYRCKSYQRARRLLDESYRVSPHWRTRHWLGKTLTQAGQLTAAEPILTEVVSEHPHTGCDLAWLYERMGDESRAIATLETYLQSYADDPYAQQQLSRLRARTLGTERLQEEVETLLELGEELPADLAPDYIKSLLTTGQGERARELINSLIATLDDRTLTRIAWVCRKLQAFDLSFRLFLHTLTFNLSSPKFLNALESDARRVGRVDELIQAYKAHADEHKRLWGRLRNLSRRLARDS
jgi:tetratricopeptide (TPR) repeat protein